MEETNIEKEEKKPSKKLSVITTIIIIISSLLILGCAGYLINSYRMLKKYDVNAFKLDEFSIPTFNSALKSKKKLVSASEKRKLITYATINSKDKISKKKQVITLKYDIKNIKLNDVYAYLEKLSKEGYTVVNLEDFYMRVVKIDDDIQIRITVGSNHLVFEYNIGIDYSEPDGSEKNNDKASNEEKENSNVESKTE